MLSITGMTLEQFADLMEGLGYKAERGERAKVKPVDQVMEEAPAVEPAPETAGDMVDQIEEDGIAPSAEVPEPDAEVPAEVPIMSETEVAPGTPADPIAAEAEPETYYTFTWAGRARRGGGEGGGGARSKPEGRSKPRAKGKGKPRGDAPGGAAKTHSAKPAPKKDKIDPDNPFAAALMGLKNDK
jgi:ATP-dependent RNA helicase SUPV3L1/SUV3